MPWQRLFLLTKAIKAKRYYKHDSSGRSASVTAEGVCCRPHRHNNTDGEANTDTDSTTDDDDDDCWEITHGGRQ